MLQWQKIPVWISNLRNYRRFEVILFSYLILVSYCVTVVEVLSAANCLTMLWCRIFFTPALLIFIFLAARATPLKSIFAQARHSVVLVGAMIYSDIAMDAVLLAVLADLFVLRTQMITRGIFWLTYGLILPFQLLTNWWLTSKNIVMYSATEIIGRRLAGAPIEDLLFGFSMILATLSLWEFFLALNRRSSKK